MEHKQEAHASVPRISEEKPNLRREEAKMERETPNFHNPGQSGSSASPTSPCRQQLRDFCGLIKCFPCGTAVWCGQSLARYLGTLRNTGNRARNIVPSPIWKRLVSATPQTAAFPSLCIVDARYSAARTGSRDGNVHTTLIMTSRI